jgi:hypothetical protein
VRDFPEHFAGHGVKAESDRVAPDPVLIFIVVARPRLWLGSSAETDATLTIVSTLTV